MDLNRPLIPGPVVHSVWFSVISLVQSGFGPTRRTSQFQEILMLGSALVSASLGAEAIGEGWRASCRRGVMPIPGHPTGSLRTCNPLTLPTHPVAGTYSAESLRCCLVRHFHSFSNILEWTGLCLINSAIFVISPRTFCFLCKSFDTNVSVKKAVSCDRVRVFCFCTRRASCDGHLSADPTAVL